MRIPSLLLLPLLLSAAGPAAWSQTKVLELVPARAEAVAYFPRPRRLEAKWTALAAMFGEKEGFLGLKAQTGLDPAKVGPGPIVKVSLPKGEGGEAWAWLVPTAQPKELLQGLQPKVQAQGWTWNAPAARKPSKAPAGATLHGAARPGFLLVASSAGALEAMVKSKGSLAAELAPFAVWMGRHDACLVATRAGIEAAAKGASASLKDKPPAAEGDPAAPQSAAPKPPKRLQSKFEGWMELAKTSVHHVLAALDLGDDGGLRVEARALISTGSPLSRELQTLAAGAGHPLDGLAAPGFALALGGEWSGIFDLQAAVFEDLDKAGRVQPGTKVRVQQALEAQNAQIRSWGMALAAPAPGQPLLSGLSSLMRVDDSAAYLAAVEAVAKAQGAFMDELGMPNAVTFAAVPGGCTVTTRLGGKEDNPGSAQLKQGLAMAFGGDAIQVSLGVLDGHRLLVLMGGPEQLQARLEEARKTPDRLAASIAAVEPDLGSGHRFALYLDLRGLRDLAQLAAGMFLGPEVKPLPTVPEVPALGITLAMDPAALELKGSVRGETLRAAAAFFQSVKTLLPSGPKPKP